MKYLYRVLSVLLVLAFFVGACAPKPVGAPAVEKPAENVTLRVATWLDAEGSAKFDVVAKAFEASHPGVTIKHEAVAGSGAAIYPDVLRTSIAAGDPPDVFYMWGGSIAGQYIDAGQVLPLNASYEKYQWDDRFSAALIERLSRDGKTYGVPISNLGMGFWYKKSTMELIGIDSQEKLPKTFAEMEEMCGKFKEQGLYCVSIGGKFGWHTMRITDYLLEAKCGPEKHDALNTLKESWDQACVVEAYDTFQQWIDKGWIVPDFLTTSPDDSRLPIFDGSAALVNEGIWWEGVLRDNEMPSDQFDFFVPPTDHSPLRFSAFYEQIMIPSNAKNQDRAAEFIDWYSSKATIEMNEESKALIGGFPANKDVKPDCATRPLTCKWIDTLATAEGTYPPTDQAFYKELMDSFFEIQDKVVAGQLTPQEAAKLFQERAAAWKAANPDKVSK